MKKIFASCAVGLASLLLLSACTGEQLSYFDDFGIFGTQARWVYVPQDA